MPPDLLLRAVPDFGPPHAPRYAIQHLGTGEYWTGTDFTDDSKKARLYDRPSDACSDMQSMLKGAYGDLPLRRYTAPVEIEVYGDVSMRTVAQWLFQSSVLNIRTHDYGNGPRGSLVFPVIHWGLIEEITRPMRELDQNKEEDLDGE